MSDACRSCPICDLPPERGDLIARLEVNHHNKESLKQKEYDLTYCNCGDLVYVSPLPSEEDILAMYAETDQFGVENSPNCAYRGERAIHVLHHIASCLVSLMRTMQVDLFERLRVLEVGAGLSWMCRAAKIVNDRNVTVAQDLSSEVAAECGWVDHYIVEDLVTGRSVDPHGPYDVVSLTHVIEHLADPVGMLERIRGLLSERGIVFVTAPYRPAGWERGADLSLWESWSYNHVPAHIQYFSSGSFEKAAAAAGLEVVAWNHHHDADQAFEGWLRRIR